MNSEKPTPEDFENWNKDPNNWYGPFISIKRIKDFLFQRE